MHICESIPANKYLGFWVAQTGKKNQVESLLVDVAATSPEHPDRSLSPQAVNFFAQELVMMSR